MDELVVEVRVPEDATDEAAVLVARTLQSAVDRGVAFAAVVHMPESAGERGRRGLGGVGERVRLLKRLRPGLAEWCRGLAFVMSEEAQRQHAKVAGSGDKLWRCPTTVTADARLAWDWARRQLRQAQ